MTERDILLKKIGTYKFAITDLNLFLNTHPNDTDTLMKVRAYEAEVAPLVKEYEERFGPLTKSDNTANTWSWVCDPWPWDKEGD